LALSGIHDADHDPSEAHQREDSENPNRVLQKVALAQEQIVQGSSRRTFIELQPPAPGEAVRSHCRRQRDDAAECHKGPIEQEVLSDGTISAPIRVRTPST
jgi:hypothetical protein